MSFCFLTSSIIFSCQEVVELDYAQPTCLKMIDEHSSLPYTKTEKRKIVRIPLLAGTAMALGSGYLASESGIKTSLLVAATTGVLTRFLTRSIIKSGTHKAAFERLRPQAHFYACQQTIGFACILHPDENINEFVDGVKTRSSLNDNYPLVTAQQKFYSAETFMNCEARSTIKSILKNHNELTASQQESLHALLEPLNNNVTYLRKTSLKLKNHHLYQEQLQAQRIAHEAEQQRKREQANITALQASAQRNQAIATERTQAAGLTQAQTARAWVNLFSRNK